MRLDTEDRLKITNTAKHLFGSRVFDDKKGGDIDLFVDAEHKVINLETQIKFLVYIEKNITQRKVDLIIKSAGATHQKIFNTAKETGIRLC